MHDEGDLRPVPAAPLRPGDRHRDRRVLLLHPGPGPGPGRFPDLAPPPVAERRAGEADQAVDRPLPASSRLARGCRRGVSAAEKESPPGWGAFRLGRCFSDYGLQALSPLLQVPSPAPAAPGLPLAGLLLPLPTVPAVPPAAPTAPAGPATP